VHMHVRRIGCGISTTILPTSYHFPVPQYPSTIQDRKYSNQACPVTSILISCTSRPLPLHFHFQIQSRRLTPESGLNANTSMKLGMYSCNKTAQVYYQTGPLAPLSPLNLICCYESKARVEHDNRIIDNK